MAEVKKPCVSKTQISESKRSSNSNNVTPRETGKLGTGPGNKFGNHKK